MIVKIFNILKFQILCRIKSIAQNRRKKSYNEFKVSSIVQGTNNKIKIYSLWKSKFVGGRIIGIFL